MAGKNICKRMPVRAAQKMEWELRGLIMAVSKMKWKEKPWKSLAGK